MEEKKLGTVESRFADLVWANEPLSSGELVKLCQQELGWKKSTTYTVLKKMIGRELFRNEGGMVSAKISRSDFYAARSEQFVEDSFHGSLPAFIAAFTSRKALTQSEVAEIRTLIDGFGKE